MHLMRTENETKKSEIKNFLNKFNIFAFGLVIHKFFYCNIMFFKISKVSVSLAIYQ